MWQVFVGTSRVIALITLTIGAAQLANGAAYQRYWNDVEANQKAALNLLSQSLPTKLSYALAQRNTSSLQQALDKDYGRFSLVVTDCLIGQPECPNQKILYATTAMLQEQGALSAVSLAGQPYDLISNPIPQSSKRQSKSVNPQQRTPISPLPPLLLGRVYYLPERLPTFQEDLKQWFQEPLKPTGLALTYTLNTATFAVSSLLIITILEWMCARQRQFRRQFKVNFAAYDQRLLDLQTALERFQGTNETAIVQVQQYLTQNLEPLQQQIQIELAQLASPTTPRQQQQAALENAKSEWQITVDQVEVHDDRLDALTQMLEVVEQQVVRLPSSVVLDLGGLQGKVQQLAQELSIVQACLVPLQALDLPLLQAVLTQTQESLSVEDKVSELQTVGMTGHLQQLDRQINQQHTIQRQLQATFAQEESRLNSTISLMADLQQQLEALHPIASHDQNQQIEELQTQVQGVQQQVQHLAALVQPISRLEPPQQHVEANQPQSIETTEWEQAKQRIDQLVDLVYDLDQSCGDLHDRTRNFDKLQDQIQLLEMRMQLFDKLSTQISLLTGHTDQVAILEQKLNTLAQGLEDQVSQVVDRQMHSINGWFHELNPYEYKILYDRRDSRNQLIAAINQCSQRLILVCPWLAKYAIDPEVIGGLRKLLGTGRQVDIGWGHLRDAKGLSSISSLEEQLQQEFLNSGVNSLKQLQDEYPKQFQLKVLGTHEKYLVCDQAFAMLGSHNFLTSKPQQSGEDREIGIYTTDPRLIDQLIQRFDRAIDRNATIAFPAWGRAEIRIPLANS